MVTNILMKINDEGIRFWRYLTEDIYVSCVVLLVLRPEVPLFKYHGSGVSCLATLIWLGGRSVGAA
jgi:hypothetical protein